MSSARERQALPFTDQLIDKPKRQRSDWRTDGNVCRDAVQRPFEKQAEREQRFHPDALELQASSSGRQDWIRQQRRALRRQMIDEESPVKILAGAYIEKPERKDRQPAAPICHREGHRRRFVRHEEIRHMPVEVEPAQALLREQTGDHDDAQHHGE